MKPPFKLNGTFKATNFFAQEQEAARRFMETQAEAERLGFQFVHGDSMIVPPVDEQTEEQKAFLAKLFTP